MIPVDPWKRTADWVLAYYLRNPDMIRNLLERLGANNIEAVGSRGFRCTCPLHHGDNDQAFAVWIDRGFTVWKCYSRCCATGNLVTLLMKKYKAPFQTAVAWLARAAGLKIDGPMLHVSPQQLHEEDITVLRKRLGIGRDEQPVVFDEAWVQQSLQGMHDPRAATAIHLLTGKHGTRTAAGDKCREFPWDVLGKFDIGFVPGGRWVLPDPQDATKRVGWFEDRISIPWRDWDGRCIGFAGRRHDGQDYLKYKTFPGTRRNFTFYGIHHPETKRAIVETGEVSLVEGYTDVWRAWCHGVFNVVAAGGTELGAGQIKLLRRFPDLATVTLYFDADTAGLTASRRMADQLKEAWKVKRGTPPPGLDPDDLLDRTAYLRGIAEARLVN